MKLDVFDVLGIVFVTLKLTEVGVVAHWSWWWVTLPWWGQLALLAGVAVIAAAAWLIFIVVIGISKAINRWKEKDRVWRESAPRYKSSLGRGE